MIRDSANNASDVRDRWESLTALMDERDVHLYTTRTFELTERGHATTALISELPAEAEEALQEFKTRFARRPLRHVVRYVYERYGVHGSVRDPRRHPAVCQQVGRSCEQANPEQCVDPSLLLCLVQRRIGLHSVQAQEDDRRDERDYPDMHANHPVRQGCRAAQEHDDQAHCVRGRKQTQQA